MESVLVVHRYCEDIELAAVRLLDYFAQRCVLLLLFGETHEADLSEQAHEVVPVNLL
jgi:hypothetical protein